MVDEERERDTDCVVGIGLKSEAVNNGSVIEMENGGGAEGNSAGSSGVQTYRRRKRAKMSSSSEDKLIEDWKVSTNSASHLTDKVCLIYSFVVWHIVFISPQKIWLCETFKLAIL